MDQKTLFTSFFEQLLSKIKPGKTYVYAQNLSGFDGIFLMKHLLSFGKVTPLFNGKIISIKVKVTGNNKSDTKTIVFKDSYLLLPLSLRKLCEAFEVESSKDYFPFKLMNIFYKGILPKLENWSGIPLNDYEKLLKEYTGVEWNFKQEAIKYCKLDCLALHQILVKFNELIFKEFHINIDKSLTLPSLAMRIYKTHYMPENSIYQILGNVESDIRQSYTGGAVDVYIPHNRVSGLLDNIKAKFITLFYYDVNSLYPSVMAMPIGKPIAFEGDIRKVEPNAYGFFYCKITSPNQLDHPILQRRVKTVNGMRTIAGLGSWEGWIYSIEMDNAIKHGYIIEILKGYQFEKGYIFKEYIEKMYNLRLQYDKSHPLNLIAKLLQNSLYGKFAMKNEGTLIDIFDSSNEKDLKKFDTMLELYDDTLADYIKIGNHYITIRKSLANYKHDEEDSFHGLEVNVAIASAISGGARVWMSLFKNNPLFKLYYSDTDSIVVDAELPSFMVGKELGQYKLEHTLLKAVFLAPKVYALITSTGDEIIKVKGLDKDELKINFNELELLLVKDSAKEFTQEKLFKKLIEGEITIKEAAYTLKVTSNKRAPIYIDNIFSNTKPYNYDEINITK